MDNLQELQISAEHGDTIAMVQFGNALMKQKRTEEAIKWWEKAAEGGRAGGAYNLARYYSGLETGVGDGEKMLDYMKSLAYAHNDGWGMLHLGIIFCGATHPLWKKNIEPEQFESQRNVNEGLRLITQGIKRAESTSKDLTLYDYDAGAEVLRAYSGPLGVEVLKLALAYKTKARGLIPPGYTAMTEAANNIISQLQDEINSRPTSTLPARIPIEATARTLTNSHPGTHGTQDSNAPTGPARAPTRVVPAPKVRPRSPGRPVPPPNDAKRRDPRAGFGLALQILLAGVFMIVMACLLVIGVFNFAVDAPADVLKLRILLYGILGIATLIIASLSMEYRWGALDSGTLLGIFVLLGSLYSAAVNTRNIWENAELATPLSEVAVGFFGNAFTTIILVGILMFITVRIYDTSALSRPVKTIIYTFLAAALGSGMFYLLTQTDSLFLEVFIAPFRSVPYVWIALLPGSILLRWAEDI